MNFTWTHHVAQPVLQENLKLLDMDVKKRKLSTHTHTQVSSYKQSDLLGKKGSFSLCLKRVLLTFMQQCHSGGQST